MKKIWCIIITLLTILAGFTFIKKINQPASTAKYTIGILQTASHPALDSVRDGFMQELNRLLENSVNYIILNAQGSIPQAHALAQQLHGNKHCSGFLTIATPATQAMSAIEKEKPIFIAAVTDPHSLGILNTNTNVCGTTDMVNSTATVKLLTQLIPHAKTIGLLYTSGELNSLVLVKQMRQELEKYNLTTINCAISNEADLPALLETACRKVDVLLAPTDNTVASAITLIASHAIKYKKPLLVSDNTLVNHGALASRGVDYHASGKQAARIAHQVLIHHKKPNTLPIEQATTDTIIINKTALTTLGLTIPDAIRKQARIITTNNQG